MEKPDILKSYMKELSEEVPSMNFTVMVMDRIKMERVYVPVVYQPLIKKQDWQRIFGILILVVLSALLLHTFFPGDGSASWIKIINSIDLSSLVKPFASLVQLINHTPVLVISGIAAISVLILFDQLYVLFSRR